MNNDKSRENDEQPNHVAGLQNDSRPVLTSVGKIPGSGVVDLGRLRVSQEFTETGGVRRLLTRVPVRRPTRHEWFQVHPDESWRFPSCVLEVKDERGTETYFADRDIVGELVNEVATVMLYPTITRQGVVSIWPIKLPGPDGRTNSWNESSLDAAERATKNWVRMVANMGLGGYDISEPLAQLPDPVWPKASFEEILELAVKGKIIDSTDHPVLRRLRGEV